MKASLSGVKLQTGVLYQEKISLDRQLFNPFLVLRQTVLKAIWLLKKPKISEVKKAMLSVFNFNLIQIGINPMGKMEIFFLNSIYCDLFLKSTIREHFSIHNFIEILLKYSLCWSKMLNEEGPSTNYLLNLNGWLPLTILKKRSAKKFTHQSYKLIPDHRKTQNELTHN